MLFNKFKDGSDEINDNSVKTFSQVDRKYQALVPKFDLMVGHSSVLAFLSTSTTLPN